VLQANQIYVAEIEEVSRLPVRGEVILGKLESHSCRVTVAFFRIVDRQRQKLCRTVFSVDRIA
jgi:hypothetical protein